MVNTDANAPPLPSPTEKNKKKKKSWVAKETFDD